MQRPNVRQSPTSTARPSNNQPSVAPRAPQTSPNSQQPKRKSILIGLGMICVLLFTFTVIYFPYRFFSSEGDGYVAVTLPPVEVRHEVIDVGKNPPIPTADTIIPPAVKKQLLAGKGLDIFLVTTYRGKDDERIKIPIEPWKTFEETSTAARQRLVTKKIAELQNKLAELAVYKPREWNFVVLVDNTEVVTKDLLTKYDNVYNDLMIDERVKQGDAVMIHLAKLTESSMIDAQTIAIPKGVRQISDDNAANLSRAKQWLFQEKGGRATSSVFRGLLNILQEYAKQPRTRVVILSDMMENDLEGTGVSFYKDEGKILLSPENWETLDQKILAGLTIPNDPEGTKLLTGLSVKIYAPPHAKKFEKVAKMAQSYSEHLLTKLGAAVETRY